MNCRGGEEKGGEERGGREREGKGGGGRAGGPSGDVADQAFCLKSAPGTNSRLLFSL